MIKELADRYKVDPETLLELWNERAAVRESMGGFSRAEAERLAWIDVEAICKKTVTQ